MTVLSFTAYGVPQPKGSMRAFQPKGFHAPIVTDGNRNVKDWQRRVADAATAAIATFPEADRQLVTGGVRCEIWYYLPRPKKFSTPKYRAVSVPHTTRPDIDKLTRAVLDALTAIVWHDDAQVVDLRTSKHYAAPTEPARVSVRVSSVAVGSLQLDSEAV